MNRHLQHVESGESRCVNVNSRHDDVRQLRPCILWNVEDRCVVVDVINLNYDEY